MASGSSGTGNSSARISSELRGSLKIPLWSARPAQARIAVHNAFWEREPKQLPKKLFLTCSCMLYVISVTITRYESKAELSELNLQCDNGANVVSVFRGRHLLKRFVVR